MFFLRTAPDTASSKRNRKKESQTCEVLVKYPYSSLLPEQSESSGKLFEFLSIMSFKYLS